ncbi:MAG TPA: hypothetical protein VGM90_04255 [Kofleriaceae bacterium]|jgi:Tfp pilus assembly protein PilV
MVELLITLVVSIFALMGAMALHSSLTAGNTYASRAQEATSVGAQVMESLRSMRSTDMATALTGSATSVPPITRTTYTTVLGRNGYNYTADVYVTLLSTTIWKVRVVAKWTDELTGDPHQIPIELLKPSGESL